MKLRCKTFLLACTLVMLCTPIIDQKAYAIEITNGETYENYTDEGNFLGIHNGGVYANRKDLNILNNTFRNNTSTQDNSGAMGFGGGGGAIYDWMGNLDIKDSLFESNKSTGTGFTTGGGALMLYQTNSLNINTTDFNKNSAEYGGAIYLSKIKQAFINKTNFNGNTANYGGGAIYYQNAKNVEIANSKFLNNKVGELNEYNKYGGAIMMNGLTNSSSIEYAIHDCIFENNEANSGGAMYVSNADVAFNNLTFNNNHAYSGGAMMVTSGSRLGEGLEINNSTFTGNTAKDDGGAIYTFGGLDVNNGTFTQNSANMGGAISVVGSDPVIISDSVFKENTAGTLGGAVYSHGGSVQINDSRFENNHAKTRGGAIATLSNSSTSSNMEVVFIHNSDFINNKADQDGGAIHVNQIPRSGLMQMFNIVSNDGKTHEFTGNMHRLDSPGGKPESNAIFIENGSVSLKTSGEGSKLLFNDGIEGSSIDKANIDMNGNIILNEQVKNVALTIKGGEVVLNSNPAKTEADENQKPIFNNVDLTLNSGTLNMQNDKIDTLNVRNLVVKSDGDTKIAFDADLSKGESDKFNVSNNMQGNLKFDAEHFDVKIKEGDKNRFQLFNKISEKFALIGDSIVQYTNKNKYTLTVGEEGYINVEKDTTNGMLDALADEGVREFRQDPAQDLTIGQNLGEMKGEYLKINFDNKTLNGGGYEGITVSEDQRLELVNVGSSVNNKALTNFKTENSGAVVNNAGELTVNNSVIKANSAALNGGAINNTGEVKIIDTSFINNEAAQDGGAIYNEGGKVTITAASKNVEFSENKVNSNDDTLVSANDITMVNSADKVAELNINGTKNVTFNDGIKGEGVIVKEGIGSLNLGGDNSGYTGDVFYNGGVTNLLKGAQYFEAQNTHFANGAMLNLANNSASDKINFGDLHLDGNARLGLDLDMNTGLSDTIAANTVSGDGKLSLSRINILSTRNASLKSMRFDFIEKDADGNSPLLDTVEYNANSNPKALGPIFKYNTEYDAATGQLVLTGGPGKTSDNYNPAVLAGPVGALAGAYLTQLNTYDMAFTNMDMYMLMLGTQREAMKLRNRYASNVEGFYSPTMNPHETKGAWFKPYSTFENVRLNRGPKVSNVAYGSFFGGDSDLYELKHGFDGIFSVYGAYNGSHQAYRGNSIYQNGGTLGAAGVLYKGNFFTGLTANVGANAGEASTMYGNENFTMLMTGVASKTGYNWELAKGKFIVQPSYLMSYSFVNTFDYKNAAGVSIESDPLNVIQITPGLKLIGNLKNGWQPYLGLSIVWNIMDKTQFKANDVSLPELSLDPYFLYGFGVQKTAGERCTGYFQTMFRSGGRNGVGFQLGFRIAI